MPARKTSRKVSRKTSKKVARKTSKKVARKTSKKVARKTSKKVSRKTSKKVARKTSRKVSRKTSRKVSRKTSRKVSRKTSKKVARKTSRKVSRKTSKKVARKTSKKVEKTSKKVEKKPRVINGKESNLYNGWKEYQEVLDLIGEGVEKDCHIRPSDPFCQKVEQEKEKLASKMKDINIRKMCPSRKITGKYKATSQFISIINSLKPGNEVKTDLGCKITIVKLLVYNAVTAVFIVDFHTEKGKIPRILKIETSAIDVSQILTENAIHRVLNMDDLYVNTRVSIGGFIFLAVVMEYLGLPLNSKVVRGRVKDVEQLFRQTKENLFKIHESRILHEDLKPDNILYDEVRNRVNIIDFGAAQYISNRVPYARYILTADWVSPYVLLDDLVDTIKIEKEEFDIPSKFYDKKSAPIEKSGFMSVRAFDDLVSLAYIFIDFYKPDMFTTVYTDKIYENVIVKYKTFREMEASLSSATDPVSKSFLESYRIAYNFAKRYSSISAQKLMVMDQLEIVQKVMRRAKLLYKFKYTNYNTDIKPFIPKWLDSFIQELGVEDVFSVDVETVYRKVTELNGKVNFDKMTLQDAEKLTLQHRFIYDPFYSGGIKETIKSKIDL